MHSYSIWFLIQGNVAFEKFRSKSRKSGIRLQNGVAIILLIHHKPDYFIRRKPWLLPAATKLWPRLCFYSCLWFCPQGGVCPSACWDTTQPPWEQTPPGADVPRRRHPPGADPPGGGTPLGADPPEKTPPEAYGQWAASTHPTGMHSCFIRRIPSFLVSTYVVCERLSVMHNQVSGWTVNFCPNSPESPFLEFQTRKPPLWKASYLRWPKFTPKYPPPNFGKLQIWDDQSWFWNTPPHFRKLQIWDDQSLLQNTPPFRKTSDLRWPKFTLDYPPSISENFRFEMTKVYSEIPPPPS